jgi:hypothetical protein
MLYDFYSNKNLPFYSILSINLSKCHLDHMRSVIPEISFVQIAKRFGLTKLIVRDPSQGLALPRHGSRAADFCYQIFSKEEKIWTKIAPEMTTARQKCDVNYLIFLNEQYWKQAQGNIYCSFIQNPIIITHEI